MHVLAAPGHPRRVEHRQVVELARTALDADRVPAHPDLVLLAQHDLDAAAGPEALLAGGDRDRPDGPAVAAYGHLVGGGVGDRLDPVPDGELRGVGGAAVVVVADLDPVETARHVHLGVRRPVRTRPVVQRRVVHPVPATLHRGLRGHLERPLHPSPGGPVGGGNRPAQGGRHDLPRAVRPRPRPELRREPAPVRERRGPEGHGDADRGPGRVLRADPYGVELAGPQRLGVGPVAALRGECAAHVAPVAVADGDIGELPRLGERDLERTARVRGEDDRTRRPVGLAGGGPPQH